MICKILTLSIFSLLNSLVYSINCYTPTEVMDQGLVSYQNNVYDVKNYIHPGGQSFINLAIGKPLETYFNMDMYNFHMDSPGTARDLQQLYVGVLFQNCTNLNQTVPQIPMIKNQNILLNAPILYSVVSASVFAFLIISVSATYNKKLYSCINNRLKFLNYYISEDVIFFLLVYIIWWTSLLFLSFLYKDILRRLGIWVSLNIAFTLLPITKNSVFISLFKLQYSKLLSIHKTIAILTLISVIVKMIVIFIKYDILYFFNMTNMLMGTISSLSIILTSLLAMPIVRKNIFELFYYSHKILCAVTVVTMSLHYISSLYYITPSLLLYLTDLIIRMNHVNKANYIKIQNIDFQGFNTTYIFLKLRLHKQVEVKPGCYFFISCKNISNLEWHPISLVSKQKENLLFCIKDMGEKSWTNNLKKLSYDEKKKIEIFLQGPYSHLKLDYTNDTYKYIIGISNGIGVTPFVSILNDVNKLCANSHLKNFKKMLFIWIVPNEAFVVPFASKFENLNKNIIEIQIYVTKSSNNLMLDEKYYSEFSIIPKKPETSKCVENFINDNKIENKGEICMISCGSPNLTSDINKICFDFKINNLFNENF